ncbi:hypothetical protein P280DRAFT_32288 [Massarina eburnea CBS 473.64]|uniref:Uncharacterized protein n=1 Tax=Massarina eburnea CBS 473.64 TaxID=1395130 RepID=A0A6A6S223_9PLEO|nr:hypothetical protein P280DRAFT_32288 [Massarina eburnea CBS 473.64]
MDSFHFAHRRSTTHQQRKHQRNRKEQQYKIVFHPSPSPQPPFVADIHAPPPFNSRLRPTETEPEEMRMKASHIPIPFINTTTFPFPPIIPQPQPQPSQTNPGRNVQKAPPPPTANEPKEKAHPTKRQYRDIRRKSRNKTEGLKEHRTQQDKTRLITSKKPAVQVWFERAPKYANTRG